MKFDSFELGPDIDSCGTKQNFKSEFMLCTRVLRRFCVLVILALSVAVVTGGSAKYLNEIDGLEFFGISFSILTIVLNFTSISILYALLQKSIFISSSF